MAKPAYIASNVKSLSSQWTLFMETMECVFIKQKEMIQGLNYLYKCIIESKLFKLISYLKEKKDQTPIDVFCWIIKTFLSLLKLNKSFDINTLIVKCLVGIIEVSSRVNDAIYGHLLSKLTNTCDLLQHVRSRLIGLADLVFPVSIEEFSLVGENLKEVQQKWNFPSPNSALHLESRNEYYHTMEAIILIGSAFDRSLISDHSQITYLNNILCLEPQYLIFPSRIFQYISTASGALVHSKQLLLCCDYLTSEEMFSLLLWQSSNNTASNQKQSSADLINDYCETLNSLFNLKTEDLLQSKLIFSLVERVGDALYCYKRVSGLTMQIHNLLIGFLNSYLLVLNYMYATCKSKFDREMILSKCITLISTSLSCQSKCHNYSIDDYPPPGEDLTEAFLRLLTPPLNFLNQGDTIYKELENWHSSISTNIHTIFILLDIAIRVKHENFRTIVVSDETQVSNFANIQDSKLSIDWEILLPKVYDSLSVTFKGYLDYCPGPHSDNGLELFLVYFANAFSTYIINIASDSDTHHESLQFALDSLFKLILHLTQLPSDLRNDSSEVILYSLVILTAHNKNVYESSQILSRILNQDEESLLIPITSVLPVLLCKLRPPQSDEIANLYDAFIRKNSLPMLNDLAFCIMAEAMPAMVLAMSNPAQSNLVKSDSVNYSHQPIFYSYYCVSLPKPDRFAASNYFPGQAKSLLDLFYFLMELFVELSHGLNDAESITPSLTTGDAVIACLIRLYPILPSNNNEYVLNYFNWYLEQLEHGMGTMAASRIQELLTVVELRHSSNEQVKRVEMKKIFAAVYNFYCTDLRAKLIMFDCYGSMLESYLSQNRSEYVWLVLEKILTSFMDTELIASLYTALPNKLKISNFDCWDHLICNKIPTFIVSVLKTNTDEALIRQFLIKLKTTLNFESVEALLRELNPQFISHIVLLSIPEAERILNCLATQFHISLSSMIFENVATIYVGLSLHSHQKLVDMLQFLKSILPDIISQLSANHRAIKDQLSLNLSFRPELIASSFDYLLSLLPRGTDNSAASGYTIQRYAGESLLAVLNALDTLVNSTSVPQQQIYVSSLSLLIESMEPEHIKRAHLALMSTLSHFLKHTNRKIFQESLICWAGFIKRLSISLPLSDPIWPHILIILNDYVWDDTSTESKFLLDAYSDLFIQLQSTIVDACSCLANLYVPESSNSSSSCHEKVKDYGNSLLATIESAPLDVRINHIVSCLTHEALSVRKFSLKCLYSLLKVNKLELYKLFVREQFVHSVFTDIISSLMNESHFIRDNETSELVASCLGMIGAIDPGQMGLKLKRKRMEVSRAAIESIDISHDLEMAVRLLNELSSCLLTTSENTENQQYVGLALQQVLKAYMHNNATLKDSISSRLSSQVLATIQPYFHSKYVYVRESESNLPPQQPASHPALSSSENAHTMLNVFTEEPCISYTHWLSRMCSKLTSFVVESQAKEIFQACSRLVSRIKPSIGHLLLPYIVSFVLVENRPSAKTTNDNYNDLFMSIVKEFMDVIECASSNVHSKNQPTYESYQLKLILKSIFSVFSFIRQIILIPPSPSSHQSRNTDIITQLRSFYDKFPPKDLSILAEYCNLYELALLLLETSLCGTILDETTSQQLSRLYMSLDDRDSILGLKSIKTHHSTLKEEILYLQTEKRIHSSIALLKHNIGQNSDDIDVHCQLIQTQLLYGFVADAQMQILHTKTKQPSWAEELHRYEIEACWRLSNWDNLAELVNEVTSASSSGDGVPLTFDPTSSWEYSIGRLFDAAHSTQEELFFSQLKVCQRSVLFQLGLDYDYNADQSYYISLARLQVLHEFEELAKIFIFSRTIPCNVEEEKNRLFVGWQESISYVKNSYLVKDLILGMRRAFLSVSDSDTDFKSEISQLWLESAMLCRKSGLHGISDHSLLLAGSTNLDAFQKLKLDIEIAKSVYASSSQMQGMKKLETILENSKKIALCDEELVAQNEIINKAELKCLKWNIALNFYDSENITKKFEALTSRSSCSETAMYNFAEYYYQLYSSEKNSSSNNSTTLSSNNMQKTKSKSSAQSTITRTHAFKFMKRCLECYLNSLTLGNKFQFSAIRKAIPLWLESTEEYYYQRQSHDPKGRSKVEADAVDQLNNTVEHYMTRIPPFKLYIVFSSILSHCLHPDEATFHVMKNMMRIVINAFPVQSIWMMVGTLKSKERNIRAMRVFTDESARPYSHSSIPLNSNVEPIRDKILDFIKTIQLFPQPNKTVSTLGELNSNLMRLTTNEFFHDFKLLLPIEYCFKHPIESGGISSLSDYNLPYMVKFENRCTKMNSLLSPLKLEVLASDGRKYGLLYKTNEDLRIDSRIMEIFWELNKLLHKDSQCRERELHIQTYAATFFCEANGLIEWVDNLKSLREILQPIYKMHKRGCSPTDIDKYIHKCKNNRSLVYQTNFEILSKFSPPVMHKWFVQQFANPVDWYWSRIKFTRSAAVMSMVGFVIGLGDRHSENLLINTESGHVVHVDYAVIFDKGLILPIPELVPFRLTHNLQDGMGVLGVEGGFRHCCELTLSLLRKEKDKYFYILRHLLNDLKANMKQFQNDKIGIDFVENRLNGLMDQRKCKDGSNYSKVSLSVEGQVAAEIDNAMNKELLLNMYPPWCIYY